MGSVPFVTNFWAWFTVPDPEFLREGINSEGDFLRALHENSEIFTLWSFSYVQTCQNLFEILVLSARMNVFM